SCVPVVVPVLSSARCPRADLHAFPTRRSSDLRSRAWLPSIPILPGGPSRLHMKNAPPISVGARGTCRLDRLRMIRALANNDDEKVSHASVVHRSRRQCQTSQSNVLRLAITPGRPIRPPALAVGA